MDPNPASRPFVYSSPSNSSDMPDLMNDPTFDPDTQSPDKASDEPDSCRICRGEGSAEEPLFYPCKCSGSIKFVHQECLMEWLSHSQKKYCELCKTPFRFTKLYSPHMPKKLPTSVFIQKAIMHVVSHLFVWLRGLLVGSVWLLCLPWLMRYAWRIMFWFGDAGWARDGGIDLITDLLGLPDSANDSFDTTLNHTITPLPSFLNITSQTLNTTRGEPLLFKLAKALVRSMYEPLRRSELLTEAAANATVDPVILQMAQQKQSSVLSEVRFLKHLTSSPTFNRLIIDILEGQIITLSVVIACILVFLIREWVLQQQPVVDLGVGDADNALAQAGGGVQEQAQNELLDAPLNADDGPEVGVEVDNALDADALVENAPIPVVDGNNILATASGEDASASQNVQDIKQVIEKTENLLNDCSPEVRQALLDRHPFLHDLEELKRRVDHLDHKIASLPETIQQLLQEKKALEGEDESSPSDIASVMEKPVEFPYTGPASNQADGDSGLAYLSSGAFGTTASKFAEASESDETVRERPLMPIRERSFLATDIARTMEEQSLDDAAAIEASIEDHSNLAEDEQRSQDSSESWQHLSSSEHEQLVHDPNVSSDVAFEDKGKGRARSPSPESAADENASTDANFGSTEPRDDMSWVSTADSIESISKNDPENLIVIDTEGALGAGVQFHENSTASDGDSQRRDAIPDSTSQPHDPPARDMTMMERVGNWFWGDIGSLERQTGGLVDVEDADDEHVVNDIADEAPFVPFAQAQPVAIPNHDVAEPVINPIAPDNGQQLNPNDPDAIEDAEDLEGILELIGMQGPILGLFQNALFSSVLILISVVACVWVPYLYGKTVLLALAVPELLIRVPLYLGTIIADLVIDLCLTLGGYMAFGIAQLYQLGMSLFHIDVTTRYAYQAIVVPAQRIAYAALQRLVGGLSATKELESKDFLYLSMVCHAGLHSIEETLSNGARSLIASTIAISNGLSSVTPEAIPGLVSKFPWTLIQHELAQLEGIKDALITLWNTGLLSVSIGEPIVAPKDPMLAYWNAKDRALAVVAGYAAVAVCSAAYLKIAPITTTPRYRRIESHIIDFCQQAGGVLKVILIISIEMIAFPLFCGFLLDFALMPLFESATLASRVSFTLASPWTSGFVHWFVGTCYMFHFALFVSMCRKIMRSGVLYFIRDPDDPTFHPVRDVLERNVITQLRKIAFSAIVYGALIVVCLGGVVWGMWYTSANVLPIHWTSSESALEFPLDILFYNFLTPIVVRFARPSDGLHTMYKWWFRRCARILRLSDFLFQDSRKDEQGHLVHRTWKSLFTRRTVSLEEDENVGNENEILDKEVYFQKDGRHVRAPASDQVRIPKGTPVFVDVDEENHRLDGVPNEHGIHAANSTMTAKVYIPPWFRVRIALFVVAVWLFAAFTGIMVTIVPLLCGRKLLSTAIPNANNVNDIYAFSLGIYILGGLLWTVLHYKPILNFLRNTLWPSSETRAQALGKFVSYTKRVLSIVYVYSALALGLPILFAVLLELYILMPIHVFFGPEESHVIHIIQDWTLGILYVRIGTRILTWDRQSRAARAIQAVVRNGYLSPSVGLATRAFILPALLAFGFLLGLPFLASTFLNMTIFRAGTADDKIRVMRLSYPIAMACVITVWLTIVTMKATERWRARIRDEVYLIGERLHNFGEKRPGPVARKSPREKSAVAAN